MDTHGRYNLLRVACLPAVLAVAALCVGGAIPAAEDTGRRAPRPSPRKHVDYLSWLNQHRAPAAEHHAANTYGAVAAGLEPMEDRASLRRASTGPWDDLPTVRSWLDGHERLLDRFYNAAQVEGSYLGIKPTSVAEGGGARRGALMDAVVPGLGVFEEASEGLLARGWQAWSAGERDTLIDNVLATLKVSHHLEHEWTMVARTTSLAVAERSYYALARALQESDNPASLAASLSDRFVAADPPLADMREAYGFEQLTAWDFLQRVYLPVGTSGKWPIDERGASMYRRLTSLVSGDSPPWEAVRASLESTGFTADLAATDAYFDRLSAWSSMPYHVAAEGEDAIVASGEALPDLMMRVFVRGMTTPRRQHARVMAVQRATHLLVHLLAWRARSGRYCDSLDELAGIDGIERWRVDPYTGSPFVYARRRDGFVLYSVGPDRKDDAARPFLPRSEAGDLVVWPMP